MNDYEIIASATTLLAAGWCQDQLQKTELGATSYCIQGAICAATEPIDTSIHYVLNDARDEAVNRALGIIRKVLPDGHEHVTLYNDALGRTQADVLAVMGKALEAVRQNELATESELVSV